MKKIITLLFITSIILSACTAGGTSVAESPTTQGATQTPKPEPTVETVSRLEANEEALKGLEITD